MERNEFTLCNADQIEVMVGINPATGKITDLYCYKNNIPCIENPETGHCYKLNTKVGKNPLFVHIQRKSHIFKMLLLNNWICLLDNEDSDYNKDVETFEKACAIYHVPKDLYIYMATNQLLITN
jgi:desulfoferrodoxin (superoxide reductase-like protein)